MSIADPETDINLWISIVSQSIPFPEQLINCQKQIDQVFSDVFEEENILSIKYRISSSDFYYSVFKHILTPLLQLTEVPESNDLDSFPLISDILINFLKLSYLYLYRNDENICNILQLLFQQDNNLYQINPSFYHTICQNFIDLGYFTDFLNYIEKISEISPTINTAQTNHDQATTDQITDLTVKMKKLPILSKIEIKFLSFIENDPSFDIETFCIKLIKPLLLFPKFSNDSIAFDLFTTVTDQINNSKYFNPGIIKFWLELFQSYLLTGSFSLILFSIRSMAKLIETDFFNECLYNFLKEEEFHQLVNLYLKVEIRQEFTDFLRVIYSSFLKNKIIECNDLLPIWETRKTNHISVRTVFFSIFEEASKTVPFESIDKFTNMVLTYIIFNKDWLNFIVKCAVNLNERNANVSEYKTILKKVNDLNFDFLDLSNNESSIDENEISSYQEIAENGLTALFIGSFNSTNFANFLNEISKKIEYKKETEKDIEILYKSLTKFSNEETGLSQSFCQQFLSQIISIFDRHDIYLMMNIVRILISDSYGCKFEIIFIKKLLSLTSDETICPSIHSFITELCLVLNQIPVDHLLTEMMTGKYEINKSFYKTIKSIILSLNNGYDEIDHFPFAKEEVLWHFCFNDSRQILRFQHFLSRIYLRNKASDEEMVESFMTNWINGFKIFYYDKNDKDDDHSNTMIEQFFDFLEIFIKKIEFLIHTPHNYHFSQYKTNRAEVKIESINDESNDSISKPFYFDQRRSISSLIEHIKLRFGFCSDDDFEVYHSNRYLSRKLSLCDEIGIENLNQLKIDNEPVLISLKNSQKKMSVKMNRTVYPSRFIVDKMNGVIDILFQYRKYHSIFYILPTFNETLIKVKKLTNDDFSSFFPYDNVNKFRYNFESFLDFYSNKEFNLLSEEQIENDDRNLIFKNSFVRKSGIIDYFISCGLSMTDENLLNLILNFLRDFSSFNPEMLENEILNEQLLNMVQQYLDDPKSISKSTIMTIFTFKLKSIPNLTKNQLFQLLILNGSSEFREGVCNFLRDVYVPLSFYSFSYDESQYEPNKTFYCSYADHIRLAKEKEKRTNQIIILNLRKTNAGEQYLDCIDAALRKNMFMKGEVDTIADYIATNFINNQINLPPKPGFNTAMKIASFLIDNEYIKHAFGNLLFSVDNFDLLANYLFCNDEDYDEYPVFNGDELFFRNCKYEFKSIEINCIDYPIGLKNLGATCYINVIIQQLFNITDFRNKLNTKCSEKVEKNFELVSALNELFLELQKSYMGVANPTKLIRLLDVDVKIHNDCCEFFLQLIDKLGISDLFNCQFKHVISAIDDENLSVESFEDFMVLPLSIRGLSNIDESLDHLFEIDYFTGDNGYIFEEGKGKVDSQKACKIHSLSDHLIIQLERFEYNHQTQEREKISSFFEFGDILEINHKNFTLTGIIVHLGESAESGHYIAYIKKKAEENSNEWFQYNDSSVSEVSQETVFEDGYENGYLLFYTKSDSDILDPADDQIISQFNKEATVCRMIFSKSLFDVMLNFLNDQNGFVIATVYFFKFLNEYNNIQYQETFGKSFLSLLQNSKDQTNYLMKNILIVWSQVSFENPLLFSKWKCMRHYTCEILKTVISEIECFENLKDLMVICCPHLYNFFYSSSEFFELVDFSLQKFPEKVSKIILETEINSKFISLFVKICVNRNSIEFQCTELSNFLQIFTRIGINDEIENAILDNPEVIESFLDSETPSDIIANFISNMKRKDELVALISENEELSDKMLILLSQL